MSENEELDDRPFAESFRREYRRTVLPSAEVPARILASVRNEARPRQAMFDLSAWLEPRSFTLRPIAVLAAAIALIGAGTLVVRWWAPERASPRGTQMNAVAPPVHEVR